MFTAIKRILHLSGNKRLATHDMYGHRIHLIGKSGFGVSFTTFQRPGCIQRLPDFTIFHDSDGFRQSLFSVAVYKEGQVIHNTFEERVVEVLGEA